LINNNIVGWAALSPVSSRCIYGGVAEISVYVANGFRGNKIGEKLLQELIRASERNGLWTIQSGVFPENTASIELHKKVGFRVIGYREKVGVLDGKWKDNILMERRSKIVGV
jgi:phosphinothricin acetyltransferase